MTPQELDTLRTITHKTIDAETLTDIKTVKINPELSGEERINILIDKVKNPYCYRSNQTVIKVGYTNTGRKLDRCLLNHFSSLKKEVL